MELFLAKMKIIITDLITEKVYLYYEPKFSCKDFMVFIENVRVEKGLEYENMSIAVEKIDKAICHFD